MGDKFLIDHIYNIEEELRILTSEFFYQLTERSLDFKYSNCKEAIINFLKQCYVDLQYNTNKYLEKVCAKLIEKIEKVEKNNQLDFFMLIDIIRFFYLFTSAERKISNPEESFNLQLFDTVSLELKHFKNLIFNSPAIEDELVQRFFENVYFFFKMIRFSKYQKNIFSDYLSKEVNLAIKCAMQINVQRESSFTLNYELKGNHEVDGDNMNMIVNKSDRKDKLVKDNVNKGQTNFDPDQLRYAYSNFQKEKLMEFKKDILTDKIVFNDDHQSIRHINNDLEKKFKQPVISFKEFVQQRDEDKKEKIKNEILNQNDSMKEENSILQFDASNSNVNLIFGNFSLSNQYNYYSCEEEQEEEAEAEMTLNSLKNLNEKCSQDK